MKPKAAKLNPDLHPANGPLARLRQLRADLPPTAKRIATYLESHAKDVIRMSITEVAEQTDASEGSIVSLCRRLGAGGFQELKILLSLFEHFSSCYQVFDVFNCNFWGFRCGWLYLNCQKI